VSGGKGVSNLDRLRATDELMAAQDLRELACRTRVIASALEGSEKVRLLALADDFDEQAADLEPVRP